MIVAKLDRLSRNAAFFAMLKRDARISLLVAEAHAGAVLIDSQRDARASLLVDEGHSEAFLGNHRSDAQVSLRVDNCKAPP
jgi:hypothetical protein